MLTIVRARSSEPLVGHLATVLSTPATDPFARDLVVVHSRGMERWISQRLARHLGADHPTAVPGHGVAAALDFPSPDDLIRQIAIATGVDTRAWAAWQPESLAWQLLDLHTSPPGDDALDGFHARMNAAGHRRVKAARTIAGHLHRYALHRPDVVESWIHDPPPGPNVHAVADVDSWQPALLRQIAARQPATHVGLMRQVVDALREGAELPPELRRIALFGFTEIPALHMAVLHALASQSEVSLLLLHPSPSAWASATQVAGQLVDGWLPVLPSRGDRPTAGSTLFSAWGRNVAEVQVLAQTMAGTAAPVTDADDGGQQSPSTLLQRLQATVVADDDAAAAGALPVDDNSVTVHACTGPARQVQVLRDQILHALAADPDLQPRDIVVMCPDVETYAPLIAAHLAGGGPDRADLRVRIADRALLQTNPMLALLQLLLSTAATRLGASTLIDLVSAEPVSRRFGFDDRALERITGWVQNTHIRWGVDAGDRTPFRLDGLRANTVAEGLDRLLLGVAMADEDLRTLGGITPYDDMEGEDVVTAGRFAEFSDRLGTTLDELRQPRPAVEWADVLARAVDRVAVAPWDDPAQRAGVAQVLRDAVGWADQGDGAEQVLDLDGIRDLLADMLAGAPSRANHMTGDLTVCTLVPMRSVPHRVICLLGMDDDAFPRRAHRHVDDLLGRQPRMADHDPAAEDRQLLLDALMAASDRLIVLHTGVDERSGESRPPCAPIAELLRVIDDLQPGHAERITRSHPLSAHDAEAFTGDTPSFDRHAHDAAIIRHTRAPAEMPSDPDERRTAAAAAGPGPADEYVPLATLERFLLNPFRAFARRSLNVWVPEDPSLVAESLPWDLNSLDGWKVGNALLQAGAVDPNAAEMVLANLRGSGFIPPPPLGDARIADDRLTVANILDVADKNHFDQVTPVPFSVELDGRRISGVVPARPDGTIVHVGYSSLKPKKLLAAWLQILLASAAQPDTEWNARIIGRARASDGGGKPDLVALHEVGSTPDSRRHKATAMLADLLALYDDGLSTPLIAPADTAYAYAAARAGGRSIEDADEEARRQWGPSDWWGRDIDDEVLAAVMGDAPMYDELRSRPARPQDQRLGADPEPHELGGLAVRIWTDLILRRRKP